MQVEDLKYSNLTVDALATYKNRAKNESGQFLIWFLENIFRLDPQDADDACVDSTMDKGVDGIFTDEGTCRASLVLLSNSRAPKRSKV